MEVKEEANGEWKEKRRLSDAQKLASGVLSFSFSSPFSTSALSLSRALLLRPLLVAGSDRNEKRDGQGISLFQTVVEARQQQSLHRAPTASSDGRSPDDEMNRSVPTIAQMVQKPISLDGQSSLPCNKLLVLGDRNSGKSSLGFKLAYEEAACGGSPLFICNKSRMQSLPLEMVHVDPDNFEDRYRPEILATIRMKYVANHLELKQLLLGLQCFASPQPTLVVIDDLSFLIDPLDGLGRTDQRLLDEYLLLLALLDDTLSFLQSTSQLCTRAVILDDNRSVLQLNGLKRTIDRAIILEPSGPSSVRLVSLVPRASALANDVTLEVKQEEGRLLWT